MANVVLNQLRNLTEEYCDSVEKVIETYRNLKGNGDGVETKGFQELVAMMAMMALFVCVR